MTESFGHSEIFFSKMWPLCASVLVYDDGEGNP